MKCSGKTIFSTHKVEGLYFFLYMDDSIGITFCENKEGTPYSPFCTPTVPAYEVPSIGKTPERTVYLRDYGIYEESIIVLIDEGVVVPNSVKKLREGIVCAQLTQKVYDKYVVADSLFFLSESP